MSGLYSSLDMNMGKRRNLLCTEYFERFQRTARWGRRFLFDYLNDLGHEQIHMIVVKRWTSGLGALSGQTLGLD